MTSLAHALSRRELLGSAAIAAGGVLAAGPGVSAAAAAADSVGGAVARQIPGFTPERRAFYIAFLETVWLGTNGPRDPQMAAHAAETFAPRYEEWPLWQQREADGLFDAIEYAMKGRRFSELSLKRRGDFLLSALRGAPWARPSRDERSVEQRRADWRRARAASRAAQREGRKGPWYSGQSSLAQPTGHRGEFAGPDESLGTKIVAAATLVTSGPGGAAPGLCVGAGS
jgi:hypothetical protein